MEIQKNIFFSMKCHQLLSKKLEALNNVGHFSEEFTISKDEPQTKECIYKQMEPVNWVSSQICDDIL